MDLFENALSESYMELEEASNPMSKAQKDKVKKMKSSGWAMMKRDGDKVVMNKDGKEVFIYSTGKTFFLSEGEEVDVTDILNEVLEQVEEDAIALEESVMSRAQSILRKVIPERTKVSLYHKTDREYIAVAIKGNRYSLLHVSPNANPVTMDQVSKTEAMDYIKPFQSSGYKKVRAARDIAGAIRRLGPALLTYALTGSAIALGFGAMIHLMSKRGMNELDAISDRISIDTKEQLEALSRSIDREQNINLDEFMDNILKELADKYRDRSIKDVPPDADIPTLDLDSILKGVQ